MPVTVRLRVRVRPAAAISVRPALRPSFRGRLQRRPRPAAEHGDRMPVAVVTGRAPIPGPGQRLRPSPHSRSASNLQISLSFNQGTSVQSSTRRGQSWSPCHQHVGSHGWEVTVQGRSESSADAPAADSDWSHPDLWHDCAGRDFVPSSRLRSVCEDEALSSAHGI